MGMLGLQTPKKSQLINAGASTIGAVAGYEAYEIAAQRLPITKEINAGILAASIVGNAVLQATVKGSGMGKTVATALLAGVSINTGLTAAEDYGVLNKLNITPVVAGAGELKGLYENGAVEYIQGADLSQGNQINLSGMNQQIDMM